MQNIESIQINLIALFLSHMYAYFVLINKYTKDQHALQFMR